MSVSSRNIVALLLTGILLFFCLSPFAADITSREEDKLQPDTAAIPHKLEARLDSLKREDRLSDWLNAWYDYFTPDPDTHITQFAIPFRTIWRKPTTAPEKVSLFYLQILAGYYQLQNGNILASTDVYEQAYRLVQNSTAIHDNEILDYLIKPLGNNYTRLGDYERAFYIQKEGLRIAQKMNDSMQQASALANLSTTARWNNFPKEALTYAKQGLRAVKQGTALQGLLFSTLADILQSNGAIDSAEVAIEKALTLLITHTSDSNLNHSYWYAGALATAATIARQQQHDQKAERFLNHAMQVYRQYFPRARFRDKMKVLVAKGQVLVNEKKYERAMSCFNEALEGLLRHKRQTSAIWPEARVLYAENTLLDALTGKARLLHLMGKDKIALQGYKRAAVVLQKLRAAIFSVGAKRTLQKQSLKTTQEAIALAYLLFKSTGQQEYAQTALQFAEEQKARLLLDDLQKNRNRAQKQQYDSLFIQQSRLSQAVAFYTHSYVDALQSEGTGDHRHWQQKISEAQYALSLLDKQLKRKYPIVSWSKRIEGKNIFNSLPGGTIAWEYFTGPDKWFGFAVDSGKVVSFASLDITDQLPEKLSSFVQHWFAAGPDNMSNQPEAYYKEAYQIYQKLHLTQLSAYSNLLIIPDGILGRLPFEALITKADYLPNPGNWPYLLLKAETSQAYSLAVWTYSQNQHAALNNSNHNGFSGFFVNSNHNKGISALNGVDREAKSINKIIAGHYFKNSAATAATLLNALQNSEVVHISTHGFLISEQQIPALQMADKKILLADLYPLQAHPSLVVISACQTAGGLLSPGEGVISLARAFTAAGAGGVISALWDINDETASDITALFYKNLKKTRDKAGALYSAKKKWLKLNPSNPTIKLPYYWAGLLYYGNSIALENALPSPNPCPYWTLAIILPVLVLLGRVLTRRKQ